MFFSSKKLEFTNTWLRGSLQTGKLSTYMASLKAENKQTKQTNQQTNKQANRN